MICIPSTLQPKLSPLSVSFLSFIQSARLSMMFSRYFCYIFMYEKLIWVIAPLPDCNISQIRPLDASSRATPWREIRSSLLWAAIPYKSETISGPIIQQSSRINSTIWYYGTSLFWIKKFINALAYPLGMESPVSSKVLFLIFERIGCGSPLQSIWS